jgi:hypothetical protein
LDFDPEQSSGGFDFSKQLVNPANKPKKPINSEGQKISAEELENPKPVQIE